MNNETFQQARSAYVSKQFDVALAKFTECLEDTSVEKAPGEVGLLYHQIGNCLVKLKDPNEAIHAYSQALVDTSYDASGSVSYNLGMVYASQGDFEDAITNFKAVTEDSRYATPYKAYVALGNSLLKLGKSAEAGAAFRAAALDESNPDPTKALLNLGVCFMALDRPMDAIASYESALQFDMKPETRNKIFANMGAGDLAVVSMDDDWCRAVAVRCAQRGLRVCELSIDRELGGRDAAFVRGDRLVVRLDGEEHDLGSVDSLKIRGSHNWENALAASALALFAGVGEDVVARGLASFSPIEHRIEPCGEVAGVHFVNDSKATNTDSVEKALTAFTPKSVVVLLGGHDKGTDLTSLAVACCREARVAVCFGAAGPRIARALEDEAAAAGSDLRVVSAEHLRDAFDAAVAAAEPGNTVLLSPACSSFDEFSNMAERGRLFKSLVAGLASKGE